MSWILLPFPKSLNFKLYTNVNLTESHYFFHFHHILPMTFTFKMAHDNTMTIPWPVLEQSLVMTNECHYECNHGLAQMLQGNKTRFWNWRTSKSRSRSQLLARWMHPWCSVPTLHLVIYRKRNRIYGNVVTFIETLNNDLLNYPNTIYSPVYPLTPPYQVKQPGSITNILNAS